MFAAIYGDTPPHGVDRVITSFPCSAISPRRSLCRQYDCSTVSGSSAVDDDDISSQWSMSPGPPSPRSVTSFQRSLSPPHDSNSDSSVDGGCDGGNDTSSRVPIPRLRCLLLQQHSAHRILFPLHRHTGLSSDLLSRKSVDLAAHGSSPYELW